MEIYQYTFAETVSMQEIEETLLLSVISVEALHGRSKVNLDAKFELNDSRRTCKIDAGNKVGRDIARVFTGLLSSEIGEDMFRVQRGMLKGVSSDASGE